MTAFRTQFVSQRYGVRYAQHFTAPAGKSNRMLKEESLVSEELSVLQSCNGKVSTWAAVGRSEMFN